jgi:hypothetical protein
MSANAAKALRRTWRLVAVEEIEIDLGEDVLVRIELLEAGRGRARRYRCRFQLLSQFDVNVALRPGVVDGIHLWGDFHAMQIAEPDLTLPFAASSRAAAMAKARKSLAVRIVAIRGASPRGGRE